MTAERIAGPPAGRAWPTWRVTRCGDRVIAPALRLAAARLERQGVAAPAGQRAAARLLLRQVDLLWRRGVIDYLLLYAVRP